MRTIIFMICFCLCSIYQAFGQSKFFNGILIDGYTNDPIANATVAIIGGGRDNTTTDGEFQIELEDDYLSGRKLKLLITHSEYGSNISEYVVDGTFPEVIKLFRNTTIIITGTVRDESSSQFLEEIKVTPSSNKFIRGYDPPSIATDEFGNFILHLAKDYFTEEVDYLKLLFRDPSGGYLDLVKTVNVHAPLDISLMPSPVPLYRQRIKVDSRVTLDIPVDAGSILNIQAGGIIDLGEYIGTSDPNGRKTGVLGFSLRVYNLIANANHGSLIVSIADSYGWQFCGESCQFEMKTSGIVQVIFDINDIKQDNNEGAYEVNLVVQ